MQNVFIRNNQTGWISTSLTLDAAMEILNNQTMAQIKLWSICTDDKVWTPVLKSPLFLEYQPPETFTVEQVLIDQIVEVSPSHTDTNPLEEPQMFVAAEENILNLDADLERDIQAALFRDAQIHQTNEQPSLFEEASAVELAPQIEEQEPANESKDAAEKRAHPRYEIRLRVIIKSGRHTYLTFTKDVSLGGLNLVNNVPESIFNTEAEIYISAPDQKNKVMFLCQPVASPLGRSRLMFTQINEKKQTILAAWIDQFIRPQAKKVS